MTIYHFSTLSDGQQISFDPFNDVLYFDETSISAADLSVAPDLRPSDLRISVISGPEAGKDVLLLNTSQTVLATSNVTFADGSLLLMGDNAAGLGDDNTGNVLNGGAGHDLLDGLAGTDTLNGGAGNDAYYMTSGTTGDVLSDSGGTDTVYITLAYWALGSAFENLTLLGSGDIDGDGNALANVLTGNSGANEFHGNQGNDTIVAAAGDDSVGGGSGNDWLEAGAGNDTLGGSGDRDHYVFREYGVANADSILDMSSNWDDIQLDIAAFSALGTTGRFVSGDARFYAAAGAASGHDATDRIVFNTTTHQLFYDADGSGSGAAQLIATLTNGVNVTATDIWAFGTPGSSPNQTINGTDGPDSLTGGPGNDTIHGLAGDDTLDGAGGDDSLASGNGSDLVIGGDGNDTLENDGTNPHREDTGIDTLQGGAGDDTYIAWDLDVIQDSGGTDLVQVGTNGSYVMPGGIENFRLGFTYDAPDSLGVTGNALDNFITGWNYRNFIFGGAGDDTIVGGEGNDSLSGDAGNDSLVGGEALDTLNGGLGQDTLSGGAQQDSFVFDAAPGIANADVVVTFDGGATFDHDWIVLDGNAMSNVGPTGAFAPDDARFYAAAGASSGHDADDRIVYDTASGRLWYDADGSGAGAAQLIATLQGAPALAANEMTVVNGNGLVINGTPDDDSLAGSASADTINGFAGNDTLDGAGDGDSMVGGTGNDLYIVDNSSDMIVEQPDEGTDEIRANTSYMLPDWVENLTLTGDGLGTGNALDNVLRGDTLGSAMLHGLAGDDTIFGGRDAFGDDGNDELNGAPLMRGGAGNDLMTAAPGGSYFEGNGGSDTMIGAGGNDEFFQGGDNDGHDVIDGGAGIDWLIAGSSSQSGVVLDLAAGTMSGGGAGGAGSATLTGIENALGTPFADRLSGDAGTNYLEGDAGDDTLDGGDGPDTLSDNQGANTYSFSVAPGAVDADVVVNFRTAEDTIRLDAGVMPALGSSDRFAAGDVRFYAAPGANAGHDADDRIVFDSSTGRVWYDPDGSGSTGAQLIVTLNIEATLVATDIEVVNGTSNGGATDGNDFISGTEGNDTIDALGGNDSVFGHGGEDSILGSAGNDLLDGGENDDTLDGGAGDDHLIGNYGADLLIGGDGNDTLESSNAGNPERQPADVNTLHGGAGDDTYIVWAPDVIQDSAGLDLVQVLIASAQASYVMAGEIENAAFFSAFAGIGSPDNLSITGNGLDNSITGWDGRNFISGGAGHDTLTGAGAADSFMFDVTPGTANADVVVDFSSGTDALVLDGNVMPAIGASGAFAAADARFFAQAGATSGHDADDRVVYDTSTGNLYYDADGSGAGAAQLFATVQGAPALAARDVSVVNGQDGSTTGATEGDDTLAGTSGDDTIDGLGGDDSISGLAGSDSLLGGEGSDTLVGGDGNDTMYGHVPGFGSDDFGNTLDGGSGDDTYVVSASSASGDTILADPGGHDLVFVERSDHWTLGAGLDDLRFDVDGFVTGVGNELDNVIAGGFSGGELYGMGGNDELHGERWTTPFSLFGGDGNDTLFGSDGHVGDTMDGGDGNDTYYVTGVGDVLDDASGTDTIFTDALYSSLGPAFENLTMLGSADLDADGNGLANVLTGNAGANEFHGNGGADTIVGNAGYDSVGGGSGNDWLEGGAGNDTLGGSGDRDHFVFREYGAANTDVVLDMSRNWDDIRLDAAAFSDLGATGRFASGDARFFSGAGATAAHDATDRIVYDTSTGNLYYDHDGSGGDAAQLVATFQGTPALLATDVWSFS